MHSPLRVIISVALVATVAGCSSIAANTNMLSDDQLLSKSAGGLGYSPSDLQLLDLAAQGFAVKRLLRAA